MSHDQGELVGQIISNRYEIDKFVGKGGMASVYLAKDTLLGGSILAMKILHENLRDNSSQYQRFLREVQLMRLVTHPNVVRTYDVGQDNEYTYYTMEYVDGVSLARILQSKQNLPIQQALHYIWQISNGLDAIHKCEIVHRDLKPPNIMVLKDNTLKITDFGVARPKVSYLTDDNNFCGTLPYVAPEVFTVDTITSATDCYSLGVTCYEILAKQLPFSHEVPAKVIAMHLHEAPKPVSTFRPDIPEWLDELILAMLAKDPADRPLMKDIMSTIEEHLQSDYPNTPILPITSRIEYNDPSSVFTPTNIQVDFEDTKPDALDNVIQTISDETKEGLITTPNEVNQLSLGRYFLGFFLALILCAVHCIIFQSDFGEKLEESVLDIWFSVRGKQKPSDDIVMVALDEQSYNNFNVPITSPWPRRLHTELLKQLKDYGVKRVVFDVLFTDKGPDEAEDQAFADAIKEIPTVLGSSLAATQKTTMSGSFIIEEYAKPYQPFANNAASLGLVDMPITYGRVRNFNTTTSDNYENILSLGAAGAGAYEKDFKLELPDKDDFINFYSQTRVFPTYSYDTVLETDSRLPDEALRDKIVVVGFLLRGSAGANQRETFESPFNGDYIYGSEIHATVISNIINGEWIKRAEHSKELLIVSCFLLVITLLIILLPLKFGGILCLLSTLGWGVIAFISFTSNIFVPGASAFLIVVPLTLAGTWLYRETQKK